MPTIRILSDLVASQIAAGEVVERPASVVKELVENALDAGAGHLRVELEGGGKRRIVVADDGAGMDRDDALLAFDRHATSKIGALADLERIATFGFRGEALASIAGVARVELATARVAGEGTRVRVVGGGVRGVEPWPHPRGTRIEVAGLFFNVPARRKFLKPATTELRRATEVVQGYALALPEVRFSLRHEGREILEVLPAGEGAAGTLRRIEQVFGSGLAAELTPLPGDGWGRAGSVWGFVGGPRTAQRRRHLVYVNRRLVRDRALLAVFHRAVREEWRSEGSPALVLFLDLPPEEVDVNVHPQKAEVRFRDPALVDRLGELLRGGLAAARGEEEAPLRLPAAGAPLPRLAWQGAGGWSAADEVAQPPQLATAVYAPLPPRPVPLSGDTEAVPSLRLLGQYKGTLILLEGPDGLYLVDQHVAHERILYERLRRQLAAEQAASQRLLAPLLLELSPAERLRLLEIAAALEPCGFTLTELSERELAVTTVPAGLAAGEAAAVLSTLARSAEAGDGAAELRTALLEATAAAAACRAAVKMHEPLSAAEMQALVSELFAAEQPYACPHGRPIVLKMGDADLERRFGRR